MMEEMLNIEKINLSVKAIDCPICGKVSKRHSTAIRKIQDIGVKASHILEIKYSKHVCLHCKKIFNNSANKYARKCGRFSNKVRDKAINMLKKKNLREVSEIMENVYFVKVPQSTLHDWYVEDV